MVMQGSINHSRYFAVRGFDMWGADIFQAKGIKSEDEAIQIIKEKIGYNERLCGLILKEKDTNSLCVYIKIIEKANPTKNPKWWHRCINIFYGKKVDNVINETESKLQSFNDAKRQIPKVQGHQHFMVNVDMWGGDLEVLYFDTFKQACNKAVEFINLDSSICGTIYNHWEKQRWELCFKDPRKTNPSKSENHNRCQTIFVGKEV